MGCKRAYEEPSMRVFGGDGKAGAGGTSRCYFDYFTKHCVVIGIDAACEEEVRTLFDMAVQCGPFQFDCVDAAESQEYCDSWYEYEGPNDEEGYGDADFTSLARTRIVNYAALGR